MGRVHGVIAGLAIALSVAGCATDAPQAAATGGGDGFPAEEARDLFEYGYRSIDERYIRPIGVGELAVAGLRGLGSLDPKLVVRRDGDTVQLATPGGTAGRFAAPGRDDAPAWADVTVRALQSARTASAPLREADPERLYKAVFDATVAHLDIHSRYAGPGEAADRRDRRNGFGGLGIRYRVVEEGIEVVRVFPDSPAEAAGLTVTDRIVRAGGTPLADLEAAAIVERLRGRPGSRLSVAVDRIERDGLLEISVQRATVVPPTVTARRDHGLAILDVDGFNRKTVPRLRRALVHQQDAASGGLRGIVLDLRGNPGGLLDQAVAMADTFLADGRIVATRGRHPRSRQNHPASDTTAAPDVPVVVLVDGRSASAAEIVGAALQDAGRGVVVGSATYGKGTVQTVIRLPNDGEITLTWSRFHAPSGYPLEKLGVLPGVCTSRAGDGLAEAPGARLDRAIRKKLTVAAERHREWTGLGVDDHAARRRLRDQCPASHRHTTGTDMRVARRLLHRPALYERVIERSTPGETHVASGR